MKSWTRSAVEVIRQIFPLYFLIFIVNTIPYIASLVLPFAQSDHLRIFRFGLGWNLRFSDCKEANELFYAQTGRPLVWLGECIEHSILNTIDELWIFRLISLACFSGASYILFRRFQSLGWDDWVAFLAATVAISVPGANFMITQGGAATMMLLMMPVTFWAAGFFLDQHGKLEQERLSKWSLAPATLVFFAILFLSLSTYPAFALCVVIIPLLEILASPPGRVKNAHIKCLRFLGVTVTTILVYYAFYSKYALWKYGKLLVLDQPYKFKLNGAGRVFDKAFELLTRYIPDSLNLWLFYRNHWIESLVGTVIIGALVAHLFSRQERQVVWRRLVWVLVFATLAVAPWLFSRVPLGADAYRYFYAFRCVFALIFIVSTYRLASKVHFFTARPVAMRGLFLTIAVFAAGSLGFVLTKDVANQSSEFLIMRSMTQKALMKTPSPQQFHFILPRNRIIDNGTNWRGEAELSSVTVPQDVRFLFTAVLKDLFGEKSALFHLLNCEGDVACDGPSSQVERALAEKASSRGQQLFKFSVSGPDQRLPDELKDGIVVIDLNQFSWSDEIRF